MLSEVKKWMSDRKRRRRTIKIATHVGNSIVDRDFVVMELNQFIDLEQVHEVVQILAKDTGLILRANVFQEVITFHHDS